MAVYLDPQEDPKRDFRLSRDAINMLMELLDINKSHGWEPDFEVLLFLYWLAHGASYSVVSRAFGSPKTSVFRAVHKVAGKIVEKRSHCITLPKPNELEATGEGFAALAQHEAFKACVGAIDGCHIRIKAPAGPASTDYTNRKLFHSVQLQAVCDSGGRFLDTFTGYPGSVHDTRVLKNSPIYTGQLYPPAGYFIVGDGGYPCIEQPICLMTPYREPLQSRVQERYNGCHSRARSVIERSFGMMKTRWRSIFFKARLCHLSSPVVLYCITYAWVWGILRSQSRKLGRTISLLPLLLLRPVEQHLEKGWQAASPHLSNSYWTMITCRECK